MLGGRCQSKRFLAVTRHPGVPSLPMHPSLTLTPKGTASDHTCVLLLGAEPDQ